ncbi:ATP-dependent helicase HrpB [Roseibium denhamense]|uniref:ATP-dependent helicase HrpB n=1 Tax=Roseibium denhamense TaxID=76305 RepID=A0ABY1NZP1_9HYPH|nr:ATP-dependent helicase HrpB [Roseibium denhamense]MTI05116.1 ATP-dependent helicase HrpB [Roseibium denhamense]SMP22802.1 ATP-dependent helicase HrpB [Roseibium denhamense]
MPDLCPFKTELPIDGVLEPLLAALETSSNAVLVAEPGAGKTTRVPLALLSASWRQDGKILVLEPRRLAARAAARRMAFELGEKPGETVGYRVRMDKKVSARTRIEVVTEGVFTRLVLDDPELSGAAAVLFDEFHERSLDGDLGLALALDVQSALRPDLRLLPMSATLDAAAVSERLGNAPVLESKGRSFPVETQYLGRSANERIEPQVVRAIRQAVSMETGSILVFLPGQAEIKRVADQLSGTLPADCQVAPLYGGLDGKAQDAAIRPADPGSRKIVLATSIAQTSLTIEGVRVVIDCGLARVPKFEPQTGLTRLETVRVSRASADQRRGRAGRTEAGVCYRLWDAAQTAALPAAEAPEILEADLTGLVLDLAAWGTFDPEDLPFPDQPPRAAWTEAKALLTDLHALDKEGRLTGPGKALARLPLHPRLSHMVLEAAASGQGYTAALMALIISEPGLGGRDQDMRVRLQTLERDTSQRAKDGKALASRWLASAGGGAKQLETESAGYLLALAYPDRVAQARGQTGRFRLANGRGADLEPGHPLAAAAFMTVADIQGKAASGRIQLGAPLTMAEIEDLFAGDILTEDVVQLTPEGAMRARRVTRYKAVELEARPIQDPDPDAVTRALMGEVKRRGISRLPWTKDQARLRTRVAYARHNGAADLPDLTDQALLQTLDAWLAPYLAGVTHIGKIDAAMLGNALAGLLPYDAAAQLEELAPSHFTAPTGSLVPIDYGAAAGPTLSVRVQELYGLTTHPAICDGQLPLILELLSPAHRAIQVTKDLPGFWTGSWSDVKADMKGRYPKHPWPDDPTTAEATRRAKPRGT